MAGPRWLRWTAAGLTAVLFVVCWLFFLLGPRSVYGLVLALWSSILAGAAIAVHRNGRRIARRQSELEERIRSKRGPTPGGPV